MNAERTVASQQRWRSVAAALERQWRDRLDHARTAGILV